MKRRKIIRIILILVVIALLGGGATVLYLFNMPHRDVVSSKADFELSASGLVQEYLSDPVSANEKYLANDGESKILIVEGVVKSVSKNYNDDYVIVIGDPSHEAGVSCTFTKETNQHAKDIKKGNSLRIKGVIRSGASYDEDLEMYENVILEKSDIVK